MSFFGSHVTLKDGPQLDAFSRLRVAVPSTVFDSQQEYGLDTYRMWDAVANGTYATASSNGSASSGGNAVGPTNSNTRMTPVTCSSTNGHYAILQSRQYVRYNPGKGHLVLITGVFAADATHTAKFVLRTSTSGSVSDSNNADQASWNIDPMDGTGPSGVTIDLTKTQILFISAQWLGVGRVVMGFDIDGVLYPCHQFLNANNLAVPYCQSFNLPVRLEGQTVGTDTVNRVGYFDTNNGAFLQTTSSVAGGTINFICCSVQSEGGEASRGVAVGASNGITTIGVTTRRPILSIRPKATFNSRTNRGHIILEDVALTAATNSAFYELIYGGTLTGASFASVNTDSCTEYDVAASTISGGLPIATGFVMAGSGAARGATSNVLDFRNPLVLQQVNSLTATQTVISVVATSFSGTSTLSAALNWSEKVI